MPTERISLTERLRQLFRQNKLTLLAFVIPFLVLLIAYMTRFVFPVGNRDILTVDLYHQYAPFLEELRSKLTTGGSLLYSWAGGLGVNFWSLFAYYLASPLNVILVIFPPAYLTEAILVITLIKIGLSGAFFYIFLRGVWRQQNLQMVAISVFYALSAFSLAYSWDLMWLDGIFILPLILLGLVRLIRDKRCLLYCISLGYILFSNYYIAFFIIIFTVLYFPVCLLRYNSFHHPLRMLASVGRFAAFSVLGAGLSAILLLPTFFSIQLTSAANDTFPSAVTHSFQLFDYIGQHFILVSPTIRDGMPNMYCGVLAMLLVPFYFFAKSVPLRQKLMHFALLLIMILSFNINVLNFVWHGFHFPNQLPYRYSFVYIFLILSIAYPALQSLKEFTGKQIGAVCAAAIGVVILAQKINTEKLELITLYITIVFIVAYAAVLTLDRVRKIDKSDWALALIFVVVAELLVSTLVTVHNIDTTEYYSDRNGYLSGIEVEQIRTELDKIKQAEGNNFYRVECIPAKTINDGFMYGYRGLSIFASTMSTAPVSTFENLGYHSNSINSYKYVNSTIVLDALFGIKYLIKRSDLVDDRVREHIVTTDEIDIYKNSYALPIGYIGLPELADWYSSTGDPFTAQTSLLSALSGCEDVFAELEQEAGEVNNLSISQSGGNFYNYTRTNLEAQSSAKVNIVNDQDRQVYLYVQVPANKPDYGYVMVGDKRVDFDAKRSTLVDIGFVPAGNKIEFNIYFNSSSTQTGTFQVFAYGLNQDVFAGAIAELREQSLTVTRFADTVVEGTVTAKQDGVFMMTVPYDKGWTVQVDGVPISTTALDGGLISFNITAGTHTIKMSFIPEWFWTGLLITLAAILILLMIYLLPKLIRKKAALANDVSSEIRPIVIPEENAVEQEENVVELEDPDQSLPNQSV